MIEFNDGGVIPFDGILDETKRYLRVLGSAHVEMTRYNFALATLADLIVIDDALPKIDENRVLCYSLLDNCWIIEYLTGP